MNGCRRLHEQRQRRRAAQRYLCLLPPIPEEGTDQEVVAEPNGQKEMPVRAVDSLQLGVLIEQLTRRRRRRMGVMEAATGLVTLADRKTATANTALPVQPADRIIEEVPAAADALRAAICAWTQVAERARLPHTRLSLCKLRDFPLALTQLSTTWNSMKIASSGGSTIGRPAENTSTTRSARNS